MDFSTLRVEQVLKQLVAIPSVNPMGRAPDAPSATGSEEDCFLETRLSDWLEVFFQQLKVPYERIEVVPGRDNVVARIDRGGHETILLDAHQDTVPVTGMTIEPFTPNIVDGRLYGRGAADVKGGMAAMLCAFARLASDKESTGSRPNGPNVVMSCTCDEESTAAGMRDLVTYWSPESKRCRLLREPPSVAIVAEPTELNCIVAHRGVQRFQIVAQGRACHSSEPDNGDNAIYRMARLLQQLETLSRQLSKSKLGHHLCGGPTLSVGRIDGGSAVNIVPERCVIEVDRRLVPGECPERVFAELKAELEASHPNIELQPPWINSPALDDQRNGPVADRLLELAKVHTPLRKVAGAFYCTNACWLDQAGVPTVVFGPGDIAQAHTADEFIHLNEVEHATEIYYQFCKSGLGLK